MERALAGNARSLDALTGLRWLAAFTVFLHHIKSTRLASFHFPYALGSPAVSFFFVLSGFILTYVYANRLNRNQPGSIRRFYFVRWARIWPLHFVCLILFVLTLSNWQALFSDRGELGKLLMHIGLLQSWSPHTSSVFVFNGVAWSISTELFFYLMFPLFLIGGQRRFWIKYICLIVLTLSLLTCLNWMARMPSMSGYDFALIGHVNPLLRLLEFCTGMAFGFFYINSADSKTSSSLLRDTLKETACIALVFGWLVGYYRLGVHELASHAWWGGETTASWLHVSSTMGVFGLLILVFARSRGIFARMVGSRPMVFLGEVSFAFYMVHMLVIKFIRQNFWPKLTMEPWAIAVCALAISLGISILLFKLVEMPAKNVLVSIYDRKFRAGFRIFRGELWKVAQSNVAFLALVMMTTSMMAITINMHQFAPATSSHQIAEKTPRTQRNVRFGNSVTLLGYRAAPMKSGVRLTMIWEKHRELKRSRFVHVINAQGKIVLNGGRHDKLFRDAEIGEEIIDVVFIPNDALIKGNTIAVGYSAKGKGMLDVRSGPRINSCGRLQLLTQPQYKRLIARKTKRFGEIASRPTKKR